MNQHTPNNGYAPANGPPQQGGYAPQGQPPQQGGYAPPQAPQQGGYAPQGQPPQQGGYAPPSQGQQVQAPQQDYSKVRVKLQQGQARRSDIDWDFWRNLPEGQAFNLPASLDRVNGCPMGSFEGQVIFSKWQEKKAEWGGGLSLRIQVGFRAMIQGHSYPYKVWTSIGHGNDAGMSEFATAVCPWKTIGEDDFGPNDALGQQCRISIGYGTGKWAQAGEEPKICIQNWRASQDAPQGAQQAPAPQQYQQQHQQQAPAPQQYQQQHQQQAPAPQQHQQQAPAPQQHQQQAPAPQQHQQQHQQQAPAPQQYQQQGGHGKTYGGAPGQYQSAAPQGAPAQVPAPGYAPDTSDLPF